MPQSLLTGQLKEKPTYRVWFLYSSFVHGVKLGSDCVIPHKKCFKSFADALPQSLQPFYVGFALIRPVAPFDFRLSSYQTVCPLRHPSRSCPAWEFFPEKLFLNNFFVGVLKVDDESSRIRGSGSVPKCDGSATQPSPQFVCFLENLLPYNPLPGEQLAFSIDVHIVHCHAPQSASRRM